MSLPRTGGKVTSAEAVKATVRRVRKVNERFSLWDFMVIDIGLDALVSRGKLKSRMVIGKAKFINLSKHTVKKIQGVVSACLAVDALHAGESGCHTAS
jgi:hypothetical protein